MVLRRTPPRWLGELEGASSYMAGLGEAHWTLRGVASTLLCMIAPIALAACALGYRTHELRYRIAVEVDTPAGLRSGSSVIEVRITETPVWDPGRPITFGLTGEAVAVDLPGGRTLFALLHQPAMPDSAIHLPLEKFDEEMERGVPRALGEAPNWSRRVAYLTSTKPSAQLVGKERPYLVRFSAIENPQTVEEIGPDALHESFGAGYKLRSVTISITEDSVSDQIHQWLPWLKGERLAQLRPLNIHSHAAIDLINDRSFKDYR